jgi:hypothetical protein
MPTIIGQEVQPDFAGTPRRMSTEDLTLWHRFKAKDLIHPVRLLFDVGVGVGKSEDPAIPPDWKQMWLEQTQRRLDALVIEEKRQIILELRARALANALGRLLVYRQLYALDPLSPLPVEVWIATDTTDPELSALFAEHGIRWITV